MIPKLPFLPEAHHFAIAAVAIRSAQLDHQIPIIVAGLLGPARNHTAQFLLKGNLSPDRLVLLLQALLRDEFPDEAEAIDGAIAEIRRVRNERNRILHWVWGKSDAPDVAVLAKLPVFGEHLFEDKTAAEIQAVADDLLKVMSALESWHHRWLDQAVASLRMMGAGLLSA
jgi:hypothetical protein